ncbi:hypothetical protein C0995_008577 [Termitomyces sp. Mi166|nr:hypothetical protein C0995_008577 [Termitomyces sp. Mi166\
MAPKPKTSPTKNAAIAKDAKSQQKSLMLPPPDPPASHAILEPEVNALSTCLMNAAIKTGQIYGFYADTRRLGIEKHAPKPPHSLTASLGREIEKYDQMVDAMESYLLRAIATLQRDLFREEKRLKSSEEAAIATRTRSKSSSLSPTANRVALPLVPDSDDASHPVPNAPAPTPTNSPPTSSKTSTIGRRPSAISISSLQRPTLPLKLDLSSTALHITAEEVSMFSSGLASPVTLAPKSARIGGTNEFPDLMAAFTSSSQTIDLTMDNDGGDVKMGLENVSGTADRPIELDIEGMDIDMAMTDLFGDPADTGSNDVNAMDGLFSPIVIEQGTNTESAKPIKTEETFLRNIGQTNNEDDIFSALNVQGNTSESQQSKDVPSVPRSAPSPASLLASFTSPSQLQGIDQISSNNIAVTEAPFDMSGLDLANLDQTFFGGATEADMNFSMDMDQFMATVNTSEGTGQDEVKKAGDS